MKKHGDKEYNITPINHEITTRTLTREVVTLKYAYTETAIKESMKRAADGWQCAEYLFDLDGHTVVYTREREEEHTECHLI